ncbi:class I SAM-dependent methyltransferase [Amycolatopsis cihanbeyliensis]|uniref:Methyltransferase family protein n=1 Tax=Amycolatopsis cihanbeyliensis TaxID=1128664 RepID=A0A542DG33_AMYCI|nr:class I SAM-dependent methyltransferase [Amycolatopsis cihanbeyliensis]TQJ02048.1 methyltransferase family protein [Amycolatopsis cihanbeyliensis]
MTYEFDKQYWEQRWRQSGAGGGGSMGTGAPNPYLPRETGELVPGTALDAGCGAGAEAIWLAARGWRVTAADISPAALTRAAERARVSGVSERLRWVETDLSAWNPGMRFDLVTTHYAHPAIPQLEFYDRIAGWVAPGGTLLIVGHLHDHGAAGGGHGQSQGPGHHPPAEASATAAAITARLDETAWEVLTAEECDRTVTGHAGEQAHLHDVVVRATRRHRSHRADEHGRRVGAPVT